MSGKGSSSSDTVVRIEVYLDDATEAVSVLTAPPFRFQLDSSALEQGDHTLRLVRIDAAGGRRERRIPFHVQHEPIVEVRGLEDGATVSGRVDIDVVAPAAAPREPVEPAGPSLWLYVLSTVLVLGGIWAFFMLVPIYSRVVAPPSTEAAAPASQPSGPPVDQTLLKAGETLYASDCASCHKPSGEGMPPTFPALAGNSFLSDASAVVKKVYEGGGSMPSHPSYTAKDLAAVATYVRNTWGNSYGGVSVSDAAGAEPKASNPAASAAQPSAPSGGSASGGTASGGSTSTGSTSTGAASTGAASGGSASSGSSSSGSPSSGSASSGSATGGQAPSGGAAGSSGNGSTSGSTSGNANGGSTGGSAAGTAGSSASTGSAPSASSGSAASGGQAAGGNEQALLSDGKQLYDSDCASCHQPSGAGIPPTFPALAGNDFLQDPAAVVQRIFDGKGTMPPHPSYTAKDLAAVASYIRESFGNSYGPVSVQEAGQAAPKAGQ